MSVIAMLELMPNIVWPEATILSPDKFHFFWISLGIKTFYVCTIASVNHLGTRSCALLSRKEMLLSRM